MDTNPITNKSLYVSFNLCVCGSIWLVRIIYINKVCMWFFVSVPHIEETEKEEAAQEKRESSKERVVSGDNKIERIEQCYRL